MKRAFLLFVVVSVASACYDSLIFNETELSFFLSSTPLWTWIETEKREPAKKETVHEVRFGDDDSFRLNQSMCIFAGRVFCFCSGKECKVFDLKTKESLAAETLPDISHHNNAQFTSTFYSKDDTFPLLILSRGDYPPGQNDFYVVRVEEKEKIILFTVIKTIHNSLEEAKNNGSWVVDEVHGRLYLYCMTNGDWRTKENNSFCIYSFSLPDFKNPNDIYLGYDDVLTKWTYPYLIHQGGTYYNGYLLFNVQNLASIEDRRLESTKTVLAINSMTGQVEAILPLDDNKETEGICVYENKLYLTFKNGSEKQNSASTVFTLSSYTLPSSISKY